MARITNNDTPCRSDVTRMTLFLDTINIMLHKNAVYTVSNLYKDSLTLTLFLYLCTEK